MTLTPTQLRLAGKSAMLKTRFRGQINAIPFPPAVLLAAADPSEAWQMAGIRIENMHPTETRRCQEIPIAHRLCPNTTIGFRCVGFQRSVISANLFFKRKPMAAYAVAHIGETRFGAEIKQHLVAIDATLGPFGGRFRIHGGPYQAVEGAWTSDLVVIEFPDLHHARDWYESPAYDQIKHLRTDNTASTIILVEGSADNHKATDILENVAQRYGGEKSLQLIARRKRCTVHARQFFHGL